MLVKPSQPGHATGSDIFVKRMVQVEGREGSRWSILPLRVSIPQLKILPENHLPVLAGFSMLFLRGGGSSEG